MKDRLITIIGVVIFAAGFALAIILAGYHGGVIQNQYNGGICRDCGGHWHLVGVAGHWKNTTYVYECDKCYQTISSDYPLQ